MTYSAIITDIEGTTTRISFVTEVLFPYARLHLAAFVRQHQQQPAVLAELTAVREQLQQPEADIEQCISALLSWLDADQKITPLKSLQGMIWQEGYQQGHFTGHLYPDAVAQLQTWQQRGIPLYIYSSGSVTAQQLLFKYSDAGDLTPLLSGYFDTRIGGKRDLASYQAILKQLQLPPAQVLFLSDVVAELDAARQAGMATVQLIREQQAASDHPVAENFYQIEV
ncbi:acireductone synthase [Alishewanella sp. SMS8]|uniref:acireductone synthase n=1 Tax=Alishewanella sp. SMS8 TaxID=2994676 RepID=UPI0027424E71|nr:acireductone synthase [Alishewanella sp. SMS8]MDP5035015.1 acireductone synthase [Alishewanella sp.]MDP5205699.1 acireductone synthase [Alishewanella sp. SMS9]MDP5460589.1 acireductone synthase [Alishewanella sp. SMS8]